MVGIGDVRRRLREKGFRFGLLEGENLCQIDSLLNAIQNSCDVDYAGSIAGYNRGVYMLNVIGDSVSCLCARMIFSW
jgi:hypothetical protein